MRTAVSRRLGPVDCTHEGADFLSAPGAEFAISFPIVEGDNHCIWTGGSGSIAAEFQKMLMTSCSFGAVPGSTWSPMAVG